MSRPWALDHVRFFRPMGFYRGRGDILGDKYDFGSMSEEQIADALISAWGNLFRIPDGERSDPDRVALWSDIDRVWHRDVECDAIEGNNAYVEALSEWAQISRGTVRVEHVAEQWHPASGAGGDLDPVFLTVVLTLNGEKYRWRIPHVGDFLNYGLLAHVNQVIAPTGTQYFDWAPGGQEACILVLTEAERARLANERGIKVRAIDNDEI